MNVAPILIVRSLSRPNRGLALAALLLAHTAVFTGCDRRGPATEASPAPDAASDAASSQDIAPLSDVADASDTGVGEPGDAEDTLALDAADAAAPADADACQPATCADVGAKCGQVPDKCGGVAVCGDCLPGLQCTDAHTCVCKPKTCKELGATCGSHADGCGGTVDCGKCPICNPPCPKGWQCSDGVCAGGDPMALALDVTMVDVAGVVTSKGQKVTGGVNCKDEAAAGDAVRVWFKEVTYGYIFGFGVQCGTLQAGSGLQFAGKVYPGIYRVVVDGSEGTNLPTYNVEVANDVIVHGPATSLAFDAQFGPLEIVKVPVSGVVMIAGQQVTVKPGCDDGPYNHIGTIDFKDVSTLNTTHVYLTCAKLQEDKGLLFAISLPPGTYTVRVSLDSQDTNFPIPTIVEESLVVDKPMQGLVYDVNNVTVSGKVTLNGQHIAATPACTPSSKDMVARVSFTQLYNFPKHPDFLNSVTFFNFGVTCQDLIDGKGLTFSGSLFPGRYRVDVIGDPTRTNLHRSWTHLQDIVIDKPLTGLSWDVPAWPVAGTLTSSGLPVAAGKNCGLDKPESVAKVTFKPLEKFGYGIDFEATCKDLSAGNGFPFAGMLSPGTYRVTAGGDPAFTNLPGHSQILLGEFVVAQPTTGLKLDVQWLPIAGKLTANGKPIVPMKSCAGSWGDTASLAFIDTVSGQEHLFSADCFELQQDQGLDFKGLIPPGYYRVEGRGDPELTGLPGGHQVLELALPVAQPASDMVFDITTVPVAGTVTIEGEKLKAKEGCQDSILNYVAKIGWQAVLHWPWNGFAANCQQLQSGDGFTFAGSVFSGTYKLDMFANPDGTNMTGWSRILAVLKVK